MKGNNMNDETHSILTTGGASNAFVKQRQLEDGLNQLPVSKRKKYFQLLIDTLKEPMTFSLIACALIYFFMGDKQEALMLFSFLVLIILITVIQESKSERALEALTDLSSPRALVLRNGKRERIPGKEIIRDDIVFVNEGDRVPADIKLIISENLYCDESLLTGESVAVRKRHEESIFMGSTIVRGSGIGKVSEIGIKTKVGKIGKSISSIGPGSTLIEQQTRLLVKKLAWISVLICLSVVLVYWWKNGDWLKGSLAGLSLAMAIMPNELPAVLTIFLALGAWRISQRRVLTRKISSIENLGAASVLCVDKTGTLTMNQMMIQKIYSGGATLDLTGKLNTSIPEEFHEILEYGILASKKDPYDPMELAFIYAGNSFLKGTEHLHADWTVGKEYPLSNDLLAISYAWKPVSAGHFVIGCKGAPESIIKLCRFATADADRELQMADSMAREGLRVLGVAKAFSIGTPLPEKQQDFNYEYLGLIGIMDPIRSEVPDAVSTCQTAGIRVIMITGDHPKTATSIAQKIGIPFPELVLTGPEIDQLSESDLREKLQRTSVFSRVMPEQKLKLVQTLQASGEIVAMTGDGVNDAPALKKADIGIAMGERGTDVARESADLILLDDDFSSIVEAIRMGRRIFNNLRSALIYLFAIHIPIAGMSVIPVFFGLPLVFFPVHIAFLHLIIEPASSVIFEMEPAGPLIMQTPPRNRNENLVNARVLYASLRMGISILLALILVFYISLLRGQGALDARALVFTTLNISGLTLLYVSQETEMDLRQKIRTKVSNTLLIVTGGTLLMLVIVLYSSTLKSLFQFSHLHLLDLLLCLGVGVGSVIWTEFLPKLKKRRMD